jgi:4-hydroxybenzoate polyprenyltransferase
MKSFGAMKLAPRKINAMNPAATPQVTNRPATGSVADSTGNWVDTLAPQWLRPYLRLARLDRTIGSWLLLLPCWWSAALAAVAAQRLGPSPWHIVLFFIGAFAMRGAGCTWNDIVDRDLDASVERTRSRPIPSGQVSVAQAVLFLILQALVGFAVLISFNAFTVGLGIASLAIVVVYPFMKRITYWPQIVLGLAFSWGALMGWAAAFGRLDWPALLLYAGSISWVIGYDTIYAHQDRDDDALIGIKSTALLFGERTKPMLALFYGLAAILIGAAGLVAHAGLIFALGLLAFAAHLGWQIRRLDISDPDNCLRLFWSNRDAGLILFAGLLLDAALRHVLAG